MVKRLPIPGSDHGDWGAILNDYLSVAHGSDGTLKKGVVGTSQLRDGVITAAKLDSSLQPLASGFNGFFAPEDYGCAVSASAATNDAAIAAAIAAATAANNGVVHFTGMGPYVVSAAINQDVSKFVVIGSKTTLNVIDTFTGPYFWSMFSSADYPYNNNLGVALIGVIIEGTALNFAPLATTALQIGHETYKNSSLFTVQDTYIQGFATGINFINNAWRIRVINCRITSGTAIAVNPGLINAGEDMIFMNCIFESYNPKINISTGEWNFINCSFNSTRITLNGNTTVRLTLCHIEPHNIYPVIELTDPMALMVITSTSLIIDPAVSINNAVFSVISSNTTRGLVIRSLDMSQSALYMPQINSNDCLLVSGGGRVDMQGSTGYINDYGFAIAASNNLLYNGDGEKGSTVGWTTFASYGSTTFTADNTVFKYGAYSLKLTTAASSIYVGQIVPCRAGQWVFAQCWNKLTIGSGTGNTFIQLDFLSSNGVVILTTGYTNTASTTGWTCRRQLSGTTPVAPAGTVSARLYIGVAGSAVTTAWYDDVILNVA